MPDGDEESPALLENLESVLRTIRDASRNRDPLTAESARGWQARCVEGLHVPHAALVGRFRGEPPLEGVEVHVGGESGVLASDVAAALRAFESKLHEVLRRLDEALPPGGLPDGDQLAAVLDAMAWTHAEWVRIHPFVNGNGRTARLFANSVAMRYGLPPFVRLRPRPDSGYGAA